MLRRIRTQISSLSDNMLTVISHFELDGGASLLADCCMVFSPCWPHRCNLTGVTGVTTLRTTDQGIDPPAEICMRGHFKKDIRYIFSTFSKIDLQKHYFIVWERIGDIPLQVITLPIRGDFYF